MMKISIPFKNQLESLKIKCTNHINGCQEVFSLGEIGKHEKLCGYQLKACPNKNCGQQVMVTFMSEHIQNCEHLPINC